MDMDSVFSVQQQQELARRPETPPWRTYRRGGLLGHEDEEALMELGRLLEVEAEERSAAFAERGTAMCSALLSAAKAVNKPASLWYLLYAIDAFLEEDGSRAEYFHAAIRENMVMVEEMVADATDTEARDDAEKLGFELYKPIMRVIPGTDGAEDAESLHARLAAVSVLRKLLPSAEASKAFSAHSLLIEQQMHAAIAAVVRALAKESEAVTEKLGRAGSAGGVGGSTLGLEVALLQSYLELLQHALQTSTNRLHFLACHGGVVLASAELLLTHEHALLSTPIDVQYRSVFCIWLLSYEPSFMARLVWAPKPGDEPRPPGVLAALPKELVALLRHCSRTRTLRVALMALGNLAASVEHGKALRRQVIDVGCIAVLEALRAKQWTDPDVLTDIVSLCSVLQHDVTDMSSWATYNQELRSGELNWSNPAHRDSKFWRSNSARFELKDGEAVALLLGLVREQLAGPAGIGDLYSSEKLAVACCDLGQLARAHANGSQLIGEQGKALVMRAMESKDEAVRREALLATQHIMVSAFR